MLEKIVVIAAIFIVLMNIFCFILMGIDKNKARKRAWRIPESTLIAVAAFFGGFGGLLGMQVFHHKTKHWKFRILFPLFTILQTAVIVVGIIHFIRFR